ncbi:recombinase RecT [Dysosmobacter welbionis]
MVPYKDKKRGTVAQFQLGYKGYIQLAERSGQYLDIDAFPVVEGEYRGRDRFTRRPILEFLEDDGDRESRPVVGYYAYFELNNGFRKVLYWSKDKMLAHVEPLLPGVPPGGPRGPGPPVQPRVLRRLRGGQLPQGRRVEVFLLLVQGFRRDGLQDHAAPAYQQVGHHVH